MQAGALAAASCVHNEARFPRSCGGNKGQLPYGSSFPATLSPSFLPLAFFVPERCLRSECVPLSRTEDPVVEVPPHIHSCSFLSQED